MSFDLSMTRKAQKRDKNERITVQKLYEEVRRTKPTIYDNHKPLNFGPGLYWKFSNEARGQNIFWHQQKGGGAKEVIWPP